MNDEKNPKPFGMADKIGYMFGDFDNDFSFLLSSMCGPVALASFLMYATWFKDMPMSFKIVWMFATYLLLVRHCWSLHILCI